MTGQGQDSLISKLDQLDRRYGETVEMMNDSAIASDAKKSIALAKEQAQLRKIVQPQRADFFT